MDIALSRHAPNRLGTLHAPDEVERAVAHRLGPHRMAARGLDPFHAELYEVPLHHGALLELCYGRETRIDFGDDADHFLFRLTLAGACELQAGSVALRPSRRSASDRMLGDLVVRVKRAVAHARAPP